MKVYIMIQSNRKSASKQTESPKHPFSIKKEALSSPNTPNVEKTEDDDVEDPQAMIQRIIAEKLMEEETATEKKKQVKSSKKSTEKKPKDPIEVLKASLSKNGAYIESNIDKAYKEDDVKKTLFTFEADLMSLKSKLPDDALIALYETKLQGWKEYLEKKGKKSNLIGKTLIILTLLASFFVCYKVIAWIFF